MNRERMEHFIKTLKDIQRRDNEQNHQHFNMSTWADYLNNDGTARCGTVACALGWLATTPYARKNGLHFPKFSYSPVYKNYKDHYAGAAYLDIDNDIAADIFHNIGYIDLIGFDDDVSPQHVIDKLQFLLDLGEEMYLY